jgi:hypothetical protein
MEINNIKYGFTIMPYYGKVYAEIYYESNKLNIHVISKKFGKWYREINDDDYKQARKWVDDQLLMIYTANK